jgi:hypothetical protein
MLNATVSPMTTYLCLFYFILFLFFFFLCFSFCFAKGLAKCKFEGI